MPLPTPGLTSGSVICILTSGSLPGLQIARAPRGRLGAAGLLRRHADDARVSDAGAPDVQYEPRVHRPVHRLLPARRPPVRGRGERRGLPVQLRIRAWGGVRGRVRMQHAMPAPAGRGAGVLWWRPEVDGVQVCEVALTFGCGKSRLSTVTTVGLENHVSNFAVIGGRGVEVVVYVLLPSIQQF